MNRQNLTVGSSIAAVVFVIALRAAGFITNLWAGIGILAMVGVLVIIERVFEPNSVHAKAAFWVFAAWMVLFIGLPSLLNNFPLTQEGFFARHRLFDMITGEREHPPGGDAFRHYKISCDNYEKAYTIMIVTDMQAREQKAFPALERALKAQATGAAPDKEDLDVLDRYEVGNLDLPTQTQLIMLRNRRQACKDFLLTHAPMVKPPTTQRPISILGWAWFLAAACVFARVIDGITGKIWITQWTFLVARIVFVIAAGTISFAWLTTQFLNPNEVLSAGRWLYWVIVFVIIIGLVICATIFKPKKIVGLALFTTILFAAGLFGDWMFWNGPAAFPTKTVKEKIELLKGK